MREDYGAGRPRLLIVEDEALIARVNELAEAELRAAYKITSKQARTQATREIFKTNKLSTRTESVLIKDALVDRTSSRPEEKDQHHKHLWCDQGPGKPTRIKSNLFFH